MIGIRLDLLPDALNNFLQSAVTWSMMIPNGRFNLLLAAHRSCMDFEIGVHLALKMRESRHLSSLRTRCHLYRRHSAASNLLLERLSPRAGSLRLHGSHNRDLLSRYRRPFLLQGVLAHHLSKHVPSPIHPLDQTARFQHEERSLLYSR